MNATKLKNGAPFGPLLLAEGPEAVRVVQVNGHLSSDEVSALQEQFREIWKGRAAKVIIDLTRCDYVDSAGLAALVRGVNQARRQGRSFVLAGVSPKIRFLLRFTGLDRLFETQASLNLAPVN
jgi:anti-sigma B factor antagonist